METFPFPDPMIGFEMTGAQLKRALCYMLREEAFDEGFHSEWYQFSDGFFCEYDRASGEILQLAMNGSEIQDGDILRAAMQGYHYQGMQKHLGIPVEEVEKNAPPAELATEAANVLEECFLNHDYVKLDGKQRLHIHR